MRKTNKKGQEEIIASFFAFMIFALIIIIFLLLFTMKGKSLEKNRAEKIGDEYAKNLMLFYLRQPVSFEEKNYSVSELIRIFYLIENPQLTRISNSQKDQIKKIIQDTGKEFFKTAFDSIDWNAEIKLINNLLSEKIYLNDEQANNYLGQKTTELIT